MPVYSLFAKVHENEHHAAWEMKKQGIRICDQNIDA
jgi:hypothetical protein